MDHEFRLHRPGFAKTSKQTEKENIDPSYVASLCLTYD